MASIKPIDRKAVVKAAEKTGIIVTIEEHTIIGGLGSAVCEIVAESGNAKVKRIGINDHFCVSGSYEYIKEKEKLTVNNIVCILKKYYNNK
jgi:transketolase